ncbi:unnamed protein product [Mytilus coruscus]|uniref:DUF6570 domain-containing protein n=1 Tax=Mytilus coruscus TaxID=42192 RepID=A0A6J8AHP1_MYTCO|nr:unnamed protein product [Mytilus coruscus]
MGFPQRPKELNLYPLEERLLSLRIPFMQIRQLPRGGQLSVKGNVVNVPVEVQPTINSLPHTLEKSGTISVKLKKKLAFKKCDFSENVRPFAVICAFHYLMRTSDLYKSSRIERNEDWITEIAKINEEETQNEKNSREQEDNQDQNDADDDSDHFSEVDENETHVGNTDTLLDYFPDDNPPCDTGLTSAPGEGQRPISLYGDPDAEYLSFPTIFCGQRRPDNKEGSVSVHYTDIVKFELRSMDKRVAHSEDIDQMTYKMFLNDVLQMNVEDYLKAIRSNLSGPKVFLKRKPSEVRVNGYIKTVLVAWQANHDLQFVIDAFACAAFIVSYISKSQKGMSALLRPGSKRSTTGKFRLEASSPESTEIESDNEIKRYSCRPKQLENWCLADYVSQLELQYPKTSESSDHENEEATEENSNKINITLKNDIRIYQRKTPKTPENKAEQYEGKVIDLEKAIEEAENDCNENDHVVPGTQQVEMEDAEIGPTESEQYVHFNPNRPIEHRQYDMSREVRIEARTVELTNHANRISESDYFTLNRSLNKKQWEFFQHVVMWVKTKHEPLYTFLTCGAGCGKSVV